MDQQLWGGRWSSSFSGYRALYYILIFTLDTCEILCKFQGDHFANEHFINLCWWCSCAWMWFSLIFVECANDLALVGASVLFFVCGLYFFFLIGMKNLLFMCFCLCVCQCECVYIYALIASHRFILFLHFTFQSIELPITNGLNLMAI